MKIKVMIGGKQVDFGVYEKPPINLREGNFKITKQLSASEKRKQAGYQLIEDAIIDEEVADNKTNN